MDFLHMGNKGYPGTGSVYTYENSFDYTRWQPNVRIRLFNIRWRIDGLHLPYFKSIEARNAYFDGTKSQPIELNVETHLMPDGTVKVPVPYDTACTYNYIEIIYPEPTSRETPLAYNDETKRAERWYFFVAKMRALAPNTTELLLVRDEWVTFANRCSIESMMLERGHYPMAIAPTPNSYLMNPIRRNGLLLTPDVTFADARNVAHVETLVMNDGETWAVFVTSANVSGNWGTFSRENVPPASSAPITPAVTGYVQGTPGCSVFGVKAADLRSFVTRVEKIAPQFVQTVQGMFLAPDKLLDFGESFTFADTECLPIESSQRSFQLIELHEEDFGFPKQFARLTKLYTFPYSQLEITDETGRTVTVRVEDTAGRIDVNASLSLAWPNISIDRILTGINGSTGWVTFQTLNERSFDYGGNWYRTLETWDVPLFAIVVSGENGYDVDSYYNRRQVSNAANTAYDNAVRSSAVTTNNTALQVAANLAMTERSNEASTMDTDYGNQLNQALQAWNAGYSRQCQALESDAQTQQAAVSIGAGAIGSAASAVTSALSGDVAGAVGSVINGVTSGVATTASTAISINLAATKTEAGIENTQEQVTSTNVNNEQRNEIQIECGLDNLTTANACSTAQAANSVSAANANASANLTTTNAGIVNERNQGALNAPTLNGTANPGTATVRPMALWANIVTQPLGAIEQAGNEMLRYGYTLNQMVSPLDLMPMKRFSYWKSPDVWLTSEQGVPESAKTAILAIFASGVTLWANPDEMMKGGLIENWKD